MIRSLLPICLHGRWLVLDADRVAEILGPRPWIVVPGTCPFIPGVLVWRGRAIAVVDLGAVLEGFERLANGAVRARSVVVQLEAGTVALPVDAVREVREVAAEDVRPPHASQQQLAVAEVDLDGVLMPLLDLAALWDDREGAAEGRP